MVAAAGEGEGVDSAASAESGLETPRFHAPQISDSYHASDSPPRLVDRNVAKRAVLKAGALGGLIGVIIPLVGVALAGPFAVFSYRRERVLFSGARLGLKLGAGAGAISFAIDYLLEIVRIFSTHSQQEFVDKAIKSWQALGVDVSNPDVQAGVHMMFTPTGIVIALIFVMILGALLAGLFGAVTAAMIGPRARR
jgi:ethanolamine transporter EutH